MMYLVAARCVIATYLPLAIATKLFPVAFSGCFFTNNTPTYILTEGPFGDKITGERVAFFRC